MKKKVIIMAMMAVGLSSFATISLNLGGGQYQDRNGDALFHWDFVGPIVQGQLFLLIADVDGNGFQSLGAIQNNTGFVAAGDVLVGSWGVNYEATYMDGELSHAINGFDSTGKGLSTGSAMMMVWFDNLMAADADVINGTPGAGKFFGYHTAWTVPADPGTYNLNHVFTGTDGRAQFEVIPEPATALLALIGGGMAWAARRAKRFHNYQS